MDTIKELSNLLQEQEDFLMKGISTETDGFMIKSHIVEYQFNEKNLSDIRNQIFEYLQKLIR